MNFIHTSKDVAIVKEVVQTLIDSAYKKENIDKCLDWLKAESVLSSDGQAIPNTVLTKLHKYTIVRKVYADSHYT